MVVAVGDSQQKSTYSYRKYDECKQRQKWTSFLEWVNKKGVKLVTNA